MYMYNKLPILRQKSFPWLKRVPHICHPKNHKFATLQKNLFDIVHTSLQAFLTVKNQITESTFLVHWIDFYFIKLCNPNKLGMTLEIHHHGTNFVGLNLLNILCPLIVHPLPVDPEVIPCHEWAHTSVTPISWFLRRSNAKICIVAWNWWYL